MKTGKESSEFKATWDVEKIAETQRHKRCHMKSKLKFNFPQGITCVFITPAYSGFSAWVYIELRFTHGYASRWGQIQSLMSKTWAILVQTWFISQVKFWSPPVHYNHKPIEHLAVYHHSPTKPLPSPPRQMSLILFVPFNRNTLFGSRFFQGRVIGDAWE